MTILSDWQPRWEPQLDDFAARWLHVGNSESDAAFCTAGHHAASVATSTARAHIDIDTDSIWSDGFALGRAAAEQDHQAQLALANALAALALVPNVAVENALCGIISRTLETVLVSVPVCATEIHAIVVKLLAEIPDAAVQTTILLHPDDAAFLDEHKVPTHVHIVPDAAVSRGSAQLRHDGGTIEHGRDRARKTLQERLGGAC